MQWLLRCNAIVSAVCKAIMPSSKRWTADESCILAIVVSNASQNKSEMKKVGANQKLGQLQAKIAVCAVAKRRCSVRHDKNMN